MPFTAKSQTQHVRLSALWTAINNGLIVDHFFDLQSHIASISTLKTRSRTHDVIVISEMHRLNK